jgi:hypothetical protein
MTQYEQLILKELKEIKAQIDSKKVASSEYVLRFSFILAASFTVADGYGGFAGLGLFFSLMAISK